MSEINKSDTVPVVFRFKDANNQDAERTFHIEKGINITFGEKSGYNTYQITEDGIFDTSTGEYINSIYTDKEEVAALQGLSQMDSDGIIPRGEKESVLTTNDITASNKSGDDLIQGKVNNQLSRMGSDKSMKEFTQWDEVGWKYYSKSGEFKMTLTDDNRDWTKISVSSQSTRDAAEAQNAAQKDNSFIRKIRDFFGL